jgi:hypothetical protein
VSAEAPLAPGTDTRRDPNFFITLVACAATTAQVLVLAS